MLNILMLQATNFNFLKHFLIKQTLLTALGVFMTALGINLFMAPHHLVSGGVSGLSLGLNYLTGFPTGLWILLFNIPIFAIAWKSLGRGFFLASLFGTVLLSTFTILTLPLSHLHFIKEPLVAALFGGAMRGVGIGFVLRVNSSQGGTDILGALIRKRYSVSMGTISLILNGIIIIFSGIMFGAEVASLGVLSIFMEAAATDKVIQGLDTSRAVTIITHKSDEIAQEIIQHLHRDVTFLHGAGSRDQSWKVIYTVVSLRQLARVKLYVKKHDPEAFMTIADVTEVVGKGFRAQPF